MIISGYIHDYDAIIAKCQKSSGVPVMKTTSLISFLGIFVTSTSSYIATTAYLKYYNLEEPSGYRCFSVKSITISIVTFVIGYLAVILSMAIDIVYETFPIVVIIYISLPIIILTLYVVKESNFTYPMILKLIKIFSCHPESEMDSDEDQYDSTSGIYIGPSRPRDLDNSTEGIYTGPARSSDLVNSTEGIYICSSRPIDLIDTCVRGQYTGPPRSLELTHISV